jgi:putative transposase
MIADRRVYVNVTAHPTAEWTARQILQTFPFKTAARYLLRARDRIYGEAFCEQGAVMNIKEVLSAPSPAWQKA